jgi:hypothetical protein
MTTGSGKSRPTWGALGVAFLVTAVVGSMLYFQGRSRRAPSAPPARPVVVATNAVSPPVAATPAKPSPDVAHLLDLMQHWRLEHPYYHALVETTGSDVSCTAEVFNYLSVDGHQETRIKTRMFKPNALAFVALAETNRVVAYFPKSNQAVEMFNSSDAKKLLVQMGWTTTTQFDPMLIFKLAQVSFVETGDDFLALTLVFPPQSFSFPPAGGNLFWTIKLDSKGKVLGVEQLVLGNRVVSKLTYFDEDQANISKLAPEIPARAIRSRKSFREAVQDEVNLLEGKTSVTI